jgi:hypothetical protein
MTDPAKFENWIDASPPPFPFGPPQGSPDEIDIALDALALAIGRAEGEERRSVASYLVSASAVSKTTKILAQLTSSRVMAFLERHKKHDAEVADALMPGVVASGAADRMARADLFRRVTMAARMVALKRACDAVRLEHAGGQS